MIGFLRQASAPAVSSRMIARRAGPLRRLGICGVCKKRKCRITTSASSEKRQEDLVDREFTVATVNCLGALLIEYVLVQIG